MATPGDDAGGGPAGGGRAGEGVVDAEFEEVDDDAQALGLRPCNLAGVVTRHMAGCPQGRPARPFGSPVLRRARLSLAGPGWQSATITRFWASPRVRRRPTSSGPTASSRCSTTRTATRATPAAEARFKEINEAYEVLKDPQKRAAYDQFGHRAFEGGMAGRPAAAGFDFGSFADVFDDLFSDFMGGRGGRRRGGATRGADLRYNLSITLEEAFAGKKAQIRVPTTVVCEACSGSGSEGGAEPTSCPSCRGTGRIRSQQGFFTVERTCPTCQGTGRIIKNPCRGCTGSGVVHREKTLAVTIPQGVEDGTRIRLSGEGEAGMRGGQPGDLYIFVSVAPAPDVPPRRAAHLLPGADPDDDGGPGRARSRCRRSRASACASRCRAAPRPASRSGSRARA